MRPKGFPRGLYYRGCKRHQAESEKVRRGADVILQRWVSELVSPHSQVAMHVVPELQGCDAGADGQTDNDEPPWGTSESIEGECSPPLKSYLAQFRANVVVNEHDHDIHNALVGDVVSRPTDAVGGTPVGSLTMRDGVQEEVHRRGGIASCVEEMRAELQTWRNAFTIHDAKVACSVRSTLLQGP